MIKMGSFRSYVGLEEYEMKIPYPVTSSFLQPHFLPGELVVGEAHNVLKFTSLSKKKGLSGSLFVTNARLVFVSSSASPEFLPVASSTSCSEDSIPLLSIHTLFYYEGSTNHSNGKKHMKKVYLGPYSNLSAAALNSLNGGGHLSGSTSSPSKTNSPQNQGVIATASAPNSHLFCSASTRIHELYVICSNFRTLRVSFKFSRVDHGQKIFNALIHWSFPGQIEKLFYLDYCKALENKTASTGNRGTSFSDPYNSPSTTFSSGIIASWIPSFSMPGDWLREIKITNTTGYRITDANKDFELCLSLPESFVVPTAMTDVRIISLAAKFRGNRPPFWVWGDANGAAIIRMGKLHNEVDSSAENAFYETLRKGNSQRKRPRIYDLDNLVTVKELRQSLTKLSELCCPESYSQYEETDTKFYSLLENTKWMIWISRVMQLAGEIAKPLISQGDVIILQENESRDTSCLLSSIVQLIVDPRFRTLVGFCILIQKEWIACGHQFHSIYLHTSPVFLLFLDVVHQLLLQNPFEFEFNEEFLSDLWDSTFDSTTGTFMFDSPFQRRNMELRKDLTAWFRILTKEEPIDTDDKSPRSSSSLPVKPVSLLNPMFKLKPVLNPPSVEKFTFSSKAVSPPLLEINSCMSHLELWHSLYLNRTIANNSSLPSSIVVSSPLLLPFAKNYSCATPTSATPTPTSFGSMDFPRSPTQASMFLFSSAINNNNEIIGGESATSIASGRDLKKELKLVDTLMRQLSISSKFNRNRQLRQSPTPPAVPSSSFQNHSDFGASGSSRIGIDNVLRSRPREETSNSLKASIMTSAVNHALGFSRPGIDRPLPRITTTRPLAGSPSSSVETGSLLRRTNPFITNQKET